MLSPKQDLILYTVKQSKPDFTWNEISAFIQRQYKIVIPWKLCRFRYECFLSKMKPETSMDELRPFKSLKENNSSAEKPDKFIFAYRQLKSNLPEDDNFKLCWNELEEEKQLIQRIIYSQDEQGKQHEKLICSQNEYFFLELLHNDIMNRCESQCKLTEKIAEQKIEQLLFEVIEKLNELLQPSIKIAQPLNIIRIMRKEKLFAERRSIIGLFYENKLSQYKDLIRQTLKRIEEVGSQGSILKIQCQHSPEQQSQLNFQESTAREENCPPVKREAHNQLETQSSQNEEKPNGADSKLRIVSQQMSSPKQSLQDEMVKAEEAEVKLEDGSIVKRRKMKSVKLTGCRQWIVIND